MIVNGKRIACETCVYWSPNPRAAPERPNGQCRQQPPAVIRSDHGLRAQFPLTDAHLWCGQHVHRDA